MLVRFLSVADLNRQARSEGSGYYVVNWEALNEAQAQLLELPACRESWRQARIKALGFWPCAGLTVLEFMASSDS